MKTLKTLLVTKGLLVAAMSTTGMTVPVAAHATEQQGVTCPSDTQASLVNGVLKCSKKKVLASMCTGVFVSSKTGINITSNVVMNPIGSDKCLAVVTGELRDSVMAPPTPGIDPAPSAFHRVINQTAPDTFEATQYVYPLGAIYVGDASHGVSCPSGFGAVGIDNNRGLRCEATLVKTAGCDLPYAAERHTGTDLCVYVQDLGITTARFVGDYTIPLNAGYTGIMGNPADHGWTLDRDRSGNVDSWTAHSFRYAVAL